MTSYFCIQSPIEKRAARVQEGQEELLHIQVRRGGGEEIPLLQGKEQRLHFAGAAVKR